MRYCTHHRCVQRLWPHDRADFDEPGHIAFASIPETASRNADKVDENNAYAAEKGVDLNSIELNVQDERSILTLLASLRPANAW